MREVEEGQTKWCYHLGSGVWFIEDNRASFHHGQWHIQEQENWSMKKELNELHKAQEQLGKGEEHATLRSQEHAQIGGRMGLEGCESKTPSFSLQ